MPQTANIKAKLLFNRSFITKSTLITNIIPMSTSGPKDYFYLIEKHLNRDEYAIMGAGSNAPTREEMEDFEKEIGYKLPEDFIDFSISSIGGLYTEVKDEIWPKPQAGDVAPAWKFAYGLSVFTLAENAPDWLSLRKRKDNLQSQTQTNFTPFLKITTDADVYCFGEDGKIYQWDHETNKFNLIDKTFIELLDEQLGELNERKEMMKKNN